VGQGGAPPGKSGLPGVGRGLSQSQSQQKMFVAYHVPGQTQKLLKPSNGPFRARVPELRLGG